MDLDKLASFINPVARLRGSFTLRSGVTATEYFDKYRFESDPILLPLSLTTCSAWCRPGSTPSLD